MTKKQYAEFVRKNRVKSNMTLGEFAEAIGASWVTIWRWENEYCMPRPDAVEYWKDRIENV